MHRFDLSSAFISAYNSSIPGLVPVDVDAAVTDLGPDIRLPGVDGAV